MFLYVRLVLCCNLTQLSAIVETDAVDGVLGVLRIIVFLKIQRQCDRSFSHSLQKQIYLVYAISEKTWLRCFVNVPLDGSVSLL